MTVASTKKNLREWKLYQNHKPLCISTKIMEKHETWNMKIMKELKFSRDTFQF